jgi:hypothetical protein
MHAFEKPALLWSGSANTTLLREFFEGADACGLRLFHKERNHWGCQGYACVEFSLVSAESAWREFQASHCTA